MRLIRGTLRLASATLFSVSVAGADEAILTPMSKANKYVISSYTGSMLIDIAEGRIIATENIADPALARQYFEQYLILGPSAPANNSSSENEINVVRTLYPDLASKPLDEQISVLEDLYIDSAFSNYDPNKPNLNHAATSEEMEACRNEIIAKKREDVIDDALADGSPVFDTVLSIRLLKEGVPAWQIDSKLSELKAIKAKERELEVGKAQLEWRRIMLTGQVTPDSANLGGGVQTPAEIEKDGNIKTTDLDPFGALLGGGIKAAVGGTSKEVVMEIVSSVVQDVAISTLTSDDMKKAMSDANERIKERNVSCAAQPNSPLCK